MIEYLFFGGPGRLEDFGEIFLVRENFLVEGEIMSL